MRSFGPAFGVAAVLLAGLLTGCTTASETGLQAEAARQLQAKVLDVTRAAAADDTSTALKALDALTADLEAKSAKGELSADKKRGISTVIAAVRADLSTVQLSAPAASVTKAGDIKPTESEAAPADSAPEAAAQPAERAPVQLDTPVQPAPAPVIADPAPAPDPVIIQEAPAPSPGPAGNNGNGKGGLGKGQEK